MAEFFGALERLAADLYPWRYVIGAGLLVAIAILSAAAYIKEWHLWAWQRRIPIAIVGAPLLALAGFLAYDLGSPLFTNVTVEEEFPAAFSAVLQDLDLGDMDMEDVDSAMKLIAMVDQEVVEDAMPEMVPEAMLPRLTAVLEDMDVGEMGEEDVANAMKLIGMVDQAAAEGAMPDMAMKTGDQAPAQPATALNIPSTPSPQVVAPQVPETMAPAGPVKLKSGEFRDQDSFHKGSGQATFYRGPDGAHLLRLENLDVTNGPDLHVILSPHPDPMNRDELKTDGYVDIGKLKGNKGNQNYEIPDDVDVTAQQSVVIYCAPFHVIFSVAPLRDES